MGALSSPSWNLGRELWPQDAIYELLLKASPFLGRIPKDTMFGETIRHIVVGDGQPQGIGSTFQTSKANKSPSLADRFDLTTKSLYGTMSITGNLMRKAKINKAVIVQPYARESKNILLSMKRELSTHLFGNGGGAIGRLRSSVTLTGNTFVLADTTKIRAFYRGMKLQLATTDGTSGVVKSGTMTIAKIVKSGPNKGTITIAEASITAAIPSAAASDFIFREDMFGSVINGLTAWLPRADPGSTDPVTGNTVPTTFLGCDRSVDTEALSGIRVDGTQLSLYEAGMSAATSICDAGGTPSLWLMSTTDWNNLRIDREGVGKLIYTESPASGIGKYKPGMTYQAITLIGPGGPIDVLADPDCPTGRSFMLMEECWTLASTGDLVQLIVSGMDEEFADSKEDRFVSDSELCCEAPGWNATIQHSAGA